ncbi:4-diphosphocytidyl-2C-methyl-D-erythritol kinase [Marinimicrobium sp. ARAG 43.8]|uniref:4-diphosphocytidyl-2C-methyl-D-erythritol kinase n=1 Tax=Marinimicrobium sp. ARAG 43.8 TaxID=3418719 RepID=UPI003CF4428E
MEYLSMTHPEWEGMWDQLAQERLNGGDPLCEYAGRGWEYMGSTPDHHHFRHDCHPETEKTEYLYIERTGMAFAWVG